MADQDDLPMMLFQMDRPLSRLNQRTLRDNLAAVTARVRSTPGAVEIVNSRHNDEDDVVMVAHSIFDRLVSQARESESLRNGIGFLVASLNAGVAVPSETLEKLGINIEIDLTALQAFQAIYPVRITHSETGSLLTHATLDVNGTLYMSEIADEEPLEIFEEELAE